MAVPDQQAQWQKLRGGLVELDRRQYQAVHTEALAMIKANVKDPVPYCLLATIAADHGNHAKACELFERAVNLEPNDPHYLALHARALTTVGRQSEARRAADAASRHAIDDAFIADMLGVTYSRTGFHELAVPWFKRAVELDPRPANFHYNLAASLQFLGAFEEAEQAYHETLRRDANAYRAWSSLVGLKRQTTEANHLESLQNLFEQLKGDEDARLHLGHAIAKTLEDLGEYEESLSWLNQAKLLKRDKSGESNIRFDELFEAAKNYRRPRSTSETSGVQPIFVIGMPRTGTTLIDRILSSNTHVASAGELNAFPGLIKAEAKTASNLVLDVETLQTAERLDLHKIGERYRKHLEPYAQGRACVVDKMPLNFFYAGLIHRALPNARIVALRRGAMDSCLSNYRQLLTVQDSYYRYTYDLLETANFYRAFDDLMRYWRAEIPSANYLEVRYEDVVQNQEPETRRLLDFCDLPFEEACLRFHENASPVSTASSVQVRQPLYSGSIGRWKRYGSKLDALQQALGELVDDA